MNTESSERKRLVSFVVPVYNEEENVLPFYEAVARQASMLEDQYECEFVFTDNHSTDRTFELLEALAGKDSRVRAYRFSKNFGYQHSIMTGYAKCRGDAAIQLDCDLQDPPKLIPDFLAQWQQGADVVYGVRMRRAEGWVNNVTRSIFYRLADFLSDEKLPVDAGDFRLISRRIIDLLCSCEDAQPYLRGTIATFGFKQVGIEYERNARERGESKFPLSKMIALALDGILNHSTVHLRISTFFGLAVSALTFFMMLGYLIAKVVLHLAWPAGFTTLAALILLSISINAMLLGIIGEYLGRMYRQIRKKPFTIIERAIERPASQDGSTSN
jgi:glycosyltransferase involved in cell wall biosynthesis